MAYFGNRKKRVESSDRTPLSGAHHLGRAVKKSRGRTERKASTGRAFRAAKTARKGR